MNTHRILELGGIAAGVVMVAFGIGSLVLGINARNTVGDELKREFIVGSPDMKPAEIEKAVEEAGLSNVTIPSCDVAEKEIRTGSDARCFAQYMRIHALESSDGLTYAQMGRFVAAADPNDPAGTSDEEAAAKDESGEPISNSARNTWVTETALSTALNVSYMAEQIALFSVVVGIALLLSGIGFIILALAVLGGSARKPAAG
jgi:F0F1-type ATP synthase membrane subunit c/vacuolar-type H+-ATPase subunit K